MGKMGEQIFDEYMNKHLENKNLHQLFEQGVGDDESLLISNHHWVFHQD